MDLEAGEAVAVYESWETVTRVHAANLEAHLSNLVWRSTANESHPSALPILAITR